MEPPTKAYIGVRHCGCVTFALLCGFLNKREEAAELKRQIKDGCDIEVVPIEEARERLTGCDHVRAPLDSTQVVTAVKAAQAAGRH